MNLLFSSSGATQKNKKSSLKVAFASHKNIKIKICLTGLFSFPSSFISFSDAFHHFNTVARERERETLNCYPYLCDSANHGPSIQVGYVYIFQDREDARPQQQRGILYLEEVKEFSD